MRIIQYRKRNIILIIAICWVFSIVLLDLNFIFSTFKYFGLDAIHSILSKSLHVIVITIIFIIAFIKSKFGLFLGFSYLFSITSIMCYLFLLEDVQFSAFDIFRLLCYVVFIIYFVLLVSKSKFSLIFKTLTLLMAFINAFLLILYFASLS